METLENTFLGGIKMEHWAKMDQNNQIRSQDKAESRKNKTVVTSAWTDF